MLDFEMAPKIREIIEDVIRVEEGDNVLILADPKKYKLGRSFSVIARNISSETYFMVMPLLKEHGNEPGNMVAEAMKTADTVFALTTYAITHTNARLDAFKEGTKTVVLRGTTEEMLIEGALTADFDELKKTTDEVRSIITEGEKVRVTSNQGTDVTFSIAGREAFALDGFFHKETGFATLPPGEAPTCPVEDSAEGRIVFDCAMDNIGALEDNIVLEVSEGRVQEIKGGKEADMLKDIVDNADENATNIAEFAIGTNPAALLIGNLAEDKKKRGTVHFAIGDNISLGGSRESSIHLDGLIEKPSVIIDDRDIVRKGKLVY